MRVQARGAQLRKDKMKGGAGRVHRPTGTPGCGHGAPRWSRGAHAHGSLCAHSSGHQGLRGQRATGRAGRGAGQAPRWLFSLLGWSPQAPSSRASDGRLRLSSVKWETPRSASSPGGSCVVTPTQGHRPGRAWSCQGHPGVPVPVTFLCSPTASPRPPWSHARGWPCA